MKAAAAAWARISAALSAILEAVGRRIARSGQRYFGSRIQEGQQLHGLFARAWPIGTTALWIAVLLTTYVLFYYLA